MAGNDLAEAVERAEGIGGPPKAKPEAAPPVPPPIVEVDASPAPEALPSKKRRAIFRKQELDRYLPHADIIRLWKRSSEGRISFCRDYSTRDLEKFQTIEAFIVSYMVRDYGWGEYLAALVKPDGSETERVPVSIEKPRSADDNGGPSPTDPSALFSAVVQAQQQMAKEAKERTKEDMGQLETLIKLVQASGGKTGGLDPAMLLLLTQQKSSAPGTDPTVQALIGHVHKLTEELGELRRDRSAPPEFATIPATSTGLDTERLVEVMRELRPQTPSLSDLMGLIQAARPPEKPGLSLTDVLTMLPTLMPVIDKLTGKSEIQEVRAALAELKKEPPKDDFFATLRKLREMRTILEEFGGRGADDSFWGWLRSLTDNLPDTAEAIGRLVSQLRGAEEVPGGDDGEGGEGDEEQVRYPDGFGTYVEALVQAKDDPGRIGATLQAFRFLGQYQPWRNHLLAMIGKARGGDRDTVLDFLRAFLLGLRDGGQIGNDTYEKTIQAFEGKIEQVLNYLKGGGKKKPAEGEPAKEGA